MSSNSKYPLILLAEDDSDDRLLAQDALKDTKLPHELKFVEDGVDLMDYLNRRNRFSEAGAAPRPGLILLDLNMPRKDGREALKEIRANPEFRRIPVVVLTTSTSEPDMVRMYDLGANSFISKPVAFEAMVNMMRTLLDYWFSVVILPVKG